MSETRAALLDRGGLDRLIGLLGSRGFRTLGPVVADGAIGPGPIRHARDLPQGWHDEQAPGRYRLHRDGDPRLFAWAVGPRSWKGELFPPRSVVWHSSGEGEGLEIVPVVDEAPPVAVIGARPCELAALSILDRVLGSSAHPDPVYRARREAAFVAVVECSTPASTCFCTSMGTGPAVGDERAGDEGVDLVLTELAGDEGHHVLARSASPLGREVLAELGGAPAPGWAWTARDDLLAAAEGAIGRALDTDGLASLLARNLGHPRWDEVAERCLSCGNCTLACPTCFCSAVEDVSDLGGTVERHRRWDSCFDLGYSYVHGGPVRTSVSSRYRQWATHKLSTWFDQFSTAGCVGCGRCITWCPVGIDLTEEAAAIRASDGAGARAYARPRAGATGGVQP